MTVCVAAAGKPGMGLMGPMGLMGKNVHRYIGERKAGSRCIAALPGQCP